MPVSSEETIETILIVDDEESVRRTFREWLESSGIRCRIVTAEDAEYALREANRQPIDLAILDWNLGAGNDGLRLLEDLYVFHPDIVAILVTGFAHQATPLHAMRMGVRDYLDKNQDLDRESFLAAVRRQLERILPAKRERRLHATLAAFREAIEKILPLVQSAATLNEPVPLSEAIRGLLRFLVTAIGAQEAVLVVHRRDPKGDGYRAYDAAGQRIEADLVSFAHSVAGAAISLGKPSVLDFRQPAGGAVQWQSFERDRQSVLAVPMAVSPETQVVLELFDKAFTADDQRLAAAGAALGIDLLRHALAERQTHQLLFTAVEGALQASDSISQALAPASRGRAAEPPTDLVLKKLREGLASDKAAPLEAEDTVRLAEAVRVLALRHGSVAVQHCIQLVEQLRELLDAVTGAGDSRT
jgi:two-component system, NtrC family, nitrogen regulation response regulator NtrX